MAFKGKQAMTGEAEILPAGISHFTVAVKKRV